MNPEDIIKVVPEIAKIAAPLAAAVPFTAIVKRMLGPAADELAEMWRDQVRMYRYDRQLKCVEKAGRMASDAGFTPKAVPPKILFPLLEGASFEDNDELHTMWAALLANASSPTNAEKVRPRFIAILKQMAPDEALALRVIQESEEARKVLLAKARASETPELAAQYRQESQSISGEPLRTVLHQRLTQTNSSFINVDSPIWICQSVLESTGLIITGQLELSNLGREFLESCEPPKRQS
jgi:hypothetical protein